jgi:hypothetical protein
VLLHGDEDQALAALRIVTPGGPGGQEVVAQAEAGFQDDEAGAALPAPGQAVALQEDVPCLGEGTVAGVIDVLEARRPGQAVVAGMVEVDLCLDDGFGLHGAGALSAQAACAASQRSKPGRASVSCR